MHLRCIPMDDTAAIMGPASIKSSRFRFHFKIEIQLIIYILKSLKKNLN